VTRYYFKGGGGMNKKIILARACSKTTTDNFISAAQAIISKGAISNVCAMFDPFAGLQPPPPPLNHIHPPPPSTHTQITKHTPKGDPSAEKTRERGVGSRGGCAAKTSAQTRKVGGGREQAATRRGGGHFATPDRLVIG
jgi:hypothetical protein